LYALDIFTLEYNVQKMYPILEYLPEVHLGIISPPLLKGKRQVKRGLNKHG
jgi:hypothetical protein